MYKSYYPSPIVNVLHPWLFIKDTLEQKCKETLERESKTSMNPEPHPASALSSTELTYRNHFKADHVCV